MTPFSGQYELMRTCRSFDGLLFCCFLFATLLFYPTLAFDIMGNLRGICLIPIVAVCWFSLGIPVDLLKTDKWQLLVRQLRLAVMIFAGLAPMLIWWTRAMENRYLLVNGALCILGGAFTTLQISALCREICNAIDARGLAWEAKLTYNLTFWLHIIAVWFGGVGVMILGPVLTGQSAVSVLQGITGFNALTDFAGYLPIHVIRGGIFMVLVTPTVFYLSLLVRMRILLQNLLKDSMKGTVDND